MVGDTIVLPHSLLVCVQTRPMSLMICAGDELARD
eukprot:COSAG02_NODE_19745_length_866_cov_1.362451_1_plen_34_part_10